MKIWVVSIVLCIGVVLNCVPVAGGVLQSTEGFAS